MARHRDPPALEVQESFETTRLARQCLIDAYARLVPIRRKTPRAGHGSLPPVAVAVSRRGGEHG
jgi:hypothetical protein